MTPPFANTIYGYFKQTITRAGMFGRGKGQHDHHVIFLLYYNLSDGAVFWCSIMSRLACWNSKENTKHRCLKCAKPVCNRSSSCYVVASEDEPGWKPGHCVAFCVPCSECSRESSEIATESIQSTSSSLNYSSVKPSKSNSCNPHSNRTLGKATWNNTVYKRKFDIGLPKAG